MTYCGVIIVRGGPMFMALVGNPCPQIYILTNIHTSVCVTFIHEIELATNKNNDPTNQDSFCYPRTLTPMNKNDSTVTISFCRSRENYTRWIKNIKIFVKHFGIRLIKVNIMDKNLTVQIYVKLVSVVTGEK